MKSTEQVLFFIPARGGSKGLPNKNLQILGGQTLIERCIQTCEETRSMMPAEGIVVVSTNDEKVAQHAERQGARVHWRPQEISGDESTTEQALEHYLRNERDVDFGEYKFDLISMLQCTSPFTRSSELLAGFDLVRKSFNSAFVGIQNHFWLYRPDEQGGLVPDGHDLKFRPSRQLVSPRYHETGAAYFFTEIGFLESRFRLNGRIGCVVSDVYGSVDIDEEHDLLQARALLGSFLNSGSVPA